MFGEAGKQEVKIALAAARFLRRPSPSLSDLLRADQTIGLDTAALEALINPADPGEVLAALLADLTQGRQERNRTGPRRLHTAPTETSATTRVSGTRHRAAGIRDLSDEPAYREPRRVPGEIGKERSHGLPHPRGSAAADPAGTGAIAGPGGAGRDRTEPATPTIAKRRARLRQSLSNPSTADGPLVDPPAAPPNTRKLSPAVRHTDRGTGAPGTDVGRQKKRRRNLSPCHALVRLAEASVTTVPEGPETHAEAGIESTGAQLEAVPRDMATPGRSNPDRQSWPATNSLVTQENTLSIAEQSGETDSSTPARRPRPRPAEVRLPDDANELAEAAWRNGVDAP